jgi:hypothetical protein
VQRHGRIVAVLGRSLLPAVIRIGDHAVNASLARMTLLAVLGACSFAVAAQSSVDVGVSVETGSSQAVTGERINAGDEPATHPFCLRSTGSRIAPRARPADRDAIAGSKDKRPACVAANGRVYTREDLDTTGAIDIADALRRLDPSIR